MPPLLGDAGAVSQELQNRLSRLAALPHGPVGRGLFDAGPQLIVDGEKGLPIRRLVGQGDEVFHIADDSVGKEAPLDLAAAAADALPVQQVQDGQSAVVVPGQDCRLPVAGGGQAGEKGILLHPVRHPDGLDDRAVVPDGHHVLVPPVLVLADEGIRRLNDPGGGAVISLQEQDLGPRIVLLKMEQRRRLRRPEAVDALVLVAHEKEVLPLPRQQAQDRVLDPGGVLGLVHAEVAIAVLKGP